MKKQLLDVAIIGGGPAGSNAALVLGRARKNVAVIDAGRPRNAVTRKAHGFLTRDGISPSEFRQIAKEQISAYPSVSFIADKAVSITKTGGHFQMTTAQGNTFASKEVLFAVGMKDQPLDIPGLAEVYGKSAFVCPYCDGWELRDKPLVIITKGDEAIHFASHQDGRTVLRFARTAHQLTDEQCEELSRHRVPVFEAPIRRIDSDDGIVQQVVLEDGTTIPCKGIFFKTELVTGSDLPRAIGCDITESGTVVVDNFGKTNIPGIYSAGDAATKLHQAVVAASMGAMAAAAINNELNLEAWEQNG